MIFLSMDIKTREFLPGLALFSSPWGIVGGLLGSAESKGSELSADRAGTASRSPAAQLSIRTHVRS